MALATAKAASLRPDIKLSQALSGYEAMLSADQKLSYKASPPDPAAVMVLTCEINRKNAGRKARRTGARLTSFLNSVKEFTSIVDLVVGSAGNPIAGAVWGTVKTAIQIASGFESYFDSLSTMLMNVGLNSPRFEKYALLYPTSTSLQKELCNYYATVVDLCSKIVLFVRKPVIKQIASALRKPFDDEFGTFQKDLTRLGTAVSEEVSLASGQLQNSDSIEGARERKETSLFRATGAVFRRETANELGQAKKWRESRLKSRFLRSCSTYNFEATLNQARKKGASTWIFDTQEYQHWRSEILPSTLLCSGIVGAGKTILCANVVEQLVLNKKSDSSVGYFFCRDDVVTSLSAREIIGSLARQVFEAVTPDNFSNLDHTGDIRFNAEQLLSHMLLLLPYHRYYILVIDGLDECEHEEVIVLIELLRSLLTSRNHVFKLFWTGRSDFAARVSEHLQSDFRIHISPSNNGPEISNFIDAALETALEDGRLKLRDPRIIMKIQDALETGAQEMFLWVAFQIDTLCAQNTDEDILNSLEDLPRGLPATFRRILRRLQLSDSANPRLGKKIFEIIAAAQRPLTSNEVVEAISITPGDTVWDGSKLVNDVSKSLESCGNFVTVDEELSTIHFAHSSVKQHLLSEPTDLDVKEYHINPSQADGNLGRIIVTYLSLDVLGKQLGKASGPLQAHTANVPTHVIKSALPKHDVVNRMALAMLRSRRTLVKDPRPDLERSVSLTQAKNTEDVFLFLPYCQEYWLHHTKTIHLDGDHLMYGLWQHLIVGDADTVELPWAPEDEGDLGEQFVGWVARNRHTALASRAIGQFYYSFLAHPVFVEGKLQRLLSLPPGLTGGLIAHPSGVRCLQVDDLLWKAIDHGNEAVAQLAIREGADVNGKRANSGNAPLHMTVLRGHEAIAKLLLENGADVNPPAGEYGSVFQIAAATNSKGSIAKLLLEKGADVNAYSGKHGMALILAAEIGNVPMMKLLLKAGANVNATQGHDTALTAAVANSNVNAVNILLEAGADINFRGFETRSPLQIAASHLNEHIVRRLLDNGARLGPGYDHLQSVKETMDRLGTTETIALLIHDNENEEWNQ